jgi:Flp pilus assembly protein TadD
LTWFGNQVVQKPAIAPSAVQTPPSVAGTRSTQVAARAGTPATSLPKATERPDAAYLAGLAALDRGDYQQALRLLSTAIEVDPRDVWAYLKRATAYEQTGDREKAIADYRSVLAIDRSAQMKRYVEAAIERLSTISPAER